MADLQQTTRVVVVCDRVLEHQLLDEFVKLGVRGWTSAYCNGKGAHAVLKIRFRSRIARGFASRW